MCVVELTQGLKRFQIYFQILFTEANKGYLINNIVICHKVQRSLDGYSRSPFDWETVNSGTYSRESNIINLMIDC